MTMTHQDRYHHLRFVLEKKKRNGQKAAKEESVNELTDEKSNNIIASIKVTALINMVASGLTPAHRAYWSLNNEPQAPADVARAPFPGGAVT